LYSSPNEFLIKVLEVGEEVEVSEALEEIEEVEATEEIEVVEATEEIKVVEATEEIEVTEVPEILNSYYIIGGSFQTEESAEKCVNILKKQGFENASSLEKNNKGNIRVYYESFAEKADALIRLDEIKRDYNESAWLLFQK
jgi:cell division protein FtsN